MVLAQEAKEAAATRRKEQTDRHSFTAKRLKEKIKNSQDKAANKKNAAATAAKAASAAADAAAVLPPKQLLNKLDLSSTKTAPSKAVLALELEARGLGAKVRRAGVKGQNAGGVISKVQELIEALVAHHNGETIIPKLTSFEGTKKSRSYDGDDTCRAFKRQQMYNQAAPTAGESAGAVKTGAGAAADMEEDAGSDRGPQGVDAAL